MLASICGGKLRIGSWTFFDVKLLHFGPFLVRILHIDPWGKQLQKWTKSTAPGPLVPYVHSTAPRGVASSCATSGPRGEGQICVKLTAPIDKAPCCFYTAPQPLVPCCLDKALNVVAPWFHTINQPYLFFLPHPPLLLVRSCPQPGDPPPQPPLSRDPPLQPRRPATPVGG
jgi:hypothetical protein